MSGDLGSSQQVVRGNAHIDAVRQALIASGTGTWRWEKASGVVDWDATMEKLCGLDEGEFSSTFQGWVEIVHPDERDVILAILDEALAQQSSFHFEHRAVWPDGSEHWLECRGQVTVDEFGEVTGTVGCAVDVTERKRIDVQREALLTQSAELMDRLDRLQRIGGLLAGAVTVDEVGHIAVDHLASPNATGSRALWVADARGTSLELVASEGFDPPVVEHFAQIATDADLPAADAFRSGKTIRSDSPRDAVAEYPLLVDVPRKSSGFIVVPLKIEGTCLGVVSVGYDLPDLPDVDVHFVEAAAGHLAQTLARVRLSESVAAWAQESVRTAERERRRREQVEFISYLTAAAATADDVSSYMDTVTAAAVPRLGDWCALHFVPEGHSIPETAVAHSDPERREWARALQERFPYQTDSTIGAPQVIRTGQTQYFEVVDDEFIDQVVSQRGADDAEVRAVVESLNLTSLITVPLTTKQGVVGAMQFVSAESGRRYDHDDVALAEAAAGRIADSLHAMWVNEQQLRIAHTLQQALLPPELPVVPGVELAARYWPAGNATEVGGDFYDVFAGAHGIWSVAIGDICGTGPHAAAVTSIARHTIRAAARHGNDHPEVLDWVNDAVLGSQRGLFCTAVYATLDQVGDRWRMRSTAAGHPLPIIHRPGGLTEPIGSPGTLLGVFNEINNTTVETLLDPGDVVLFYTDGVTDLPAPYAITPDEVVTLMAEVGSAGSPEAVADAIFASIADRVPDVSRRDDVALVVLRIE